MSFFDLIVAHFAQSLESQDNGLLHALNVKSPCRHKRNPRCGQWVLNKSGSPVSVYKPIELFEWQCEWHPFTPGEATCQPAQHECLPGHTCSSSIAQHHAKRGHRKRTLAISPICPTRGLLCSSFWVKACFLIRGYNKLPNRDYMGVSRYEAIQVRPWS